MHIQLLILRQQDSQDRFGILLKMLRFFRKKGVGFQTMLVGDLDTKKFDSS